MKEVNTGSDAVSAADIANIEEILGDLTVEASTENEVVEDVQNEIDDLVLSEAEESAVEAVDALSEAMAEQTVSATGAEVPAETATPAKKARAKREPKEKKPKVERDLNALPVETFQITNGIDSDKDAVIALRPTQKKVAEKFDNLFVCLAACRKPSVYVMACHAALVEKGSVTQSDLVATLKATSKKNGGEYNEGTARSQAGQIMILFNAVGIAGRVGQTLTHIADSAISAKLLVL